MTLNSEKRKVLILCVIAYLVSYICRANLSLAMDPLMETLSVDAFRLSLVSTVFFWMYALGQLLGGFLASRFNPCRILTAGLVLTGILNLLVSASSNMFSITLFWGLNGLSLALFWPAIVEICSRKFTDDEYAGISMILNLPCTLGYLVSWLSFSNLAETSTWRLLFAIPGAVAFAFLCAWCLSGIGIQEVPHAGTQGKDGEKAGAWHSMMTISMLAFALIMMLEGAARESMNLWAPALVSENIPGNRGFSSLTLSIIPLFSTAGLFLTGHFLKDMDEHRNNVVASILVLISLASSVFMYLGRNSFPIFLLFYSVSLSSIYAGAAVIGTLVPFRIAASGKSAMVSGILNFMAYVGASLGTMLSGYMATAFGNTGIYVLWIAFTLVPVLLIPLIGRRN